MAHRISVQMPGQQAKGRNRYPAVTITLDGSPFAFVFRFAYVEDENGERAVCAESGIEQRFDDPLEQDIAELRPAYVREFSERWEALEQNARAALGIDPDHASSSPPRPPRTRRELTPAFLEEIVRRYDAHRDRGAPPAEAIAREEGVSTGTVRYWLRKARGESFTLPG
jgi:hypothetical protein